MKYLLFICIFFVFNLIFPNTNKLIISNYIENYINCSGVFIGDIVSPLDPIEKYLTFEEREELYNKYKKNFCDYFILSIYNIIPGLGLSILGNEYKPFYLSMSISLPLLIGGFGFNILGNIESNDNLKLIYNSLACGFYCGLASIYLINYYFLIEILNQHNINLNNFLKLYHNDTLTIEINFKF